MSGVNIPLLRAVVEWVEAQEALPEIDREWFQRNWLAEPYERASIMMHTVPGVRSPGVRDVLANHCGTAYCVAGKIAADHDSRFRNKSWAHVNDEMLHSSQYARQLLGISGEQAEILFRANNTAAQIREIAEEIAGGAL